MQRIKNSSGIGHLFACSVLALLLCYIVFEKKNDRHGLLCSVLQQNVERSNTALQTNNRIMAMEIKSIAACYPYAMAKKTAERVDTLQEMKDSLIQFFNTANTSGKYHDLKSAQQAYTAYLTKAKSFMNGHEPSLSVLNALAFNDSISSKWPVLWSQSPENRGLIISLLQDNIHKVFSTSLNYCAQRITHDGIFDVFRPVVSLTKLNFTDQPFFEGDVLLSWSGICNFRGIQNYKLFIDGKEYPTNPFSETQFSKVYEQAGTYPMHVRTESYNIMLDSVFVSEKTYYVRVK
jgi:hypothetical protein